MGKEKRISVRTPGEVYTKLLQRSYELNLNHREYYLALALKDLGLDGEGESILTEGDAIKLKALIKEMSKSD